MKPIAEHANLHNIPPQVMSAKFLVNMLPGVQSHRWAGIFSVFNLFSQVISSEDSDSPAVYVDLFPSSGVPSGIVHNIIVL